MGLAVGRDKMTGEGRNRAPGGVDDPQRMPDFIGDATLLSGDGTGWFHYGLLAIL